MHFELGRTLAAKDVRIYTNHPLHSKDGSNSQKYRELSWNSYTDNPVDLFDKYAATPLVLAGSFDYYFTIGDRYVITFESWVLAEETISRNVKALARIVSCNYELFI